RPEDRIVLIVFDATLAAGQRPSTTEEALEVGWFAPADIPWAGLAFWSTELALRDAISRRPAPPA
ncbi:MAG TPA: hypothetical protein VIL49_00815, partial [Capillimicrobium sp.]